jgi:hypothetical protein
MVMNFLILQKVDKFLTNLVTMNFSRRILFHFIIDYPHKYLVNSEYYNVLHYAVLFIYRVETSPNILVKYPILKHNSCSFHVV